MSVVVTCSHCRKRVQVPDSMRGKEVKCPNCRSALITPAADDPYLSDLLEAVATSSQTAAQPRPSGDLSRPASIGAARPKPQTPAWKQGAAAGFFRTNVWTIVTVLSVLPYVLLYQTALVLIPTIFIAGFVFISEWGRRSHKSREGLNPVDRILFGVYVGLGLLGIGSFLVVGVIMAVHEPQPKLSLPVVLVITAGMATVAGIFWAICYAVGSAFGLGRTTAFFHLLYGLCGLVLLIAAPDLVRQQMIAAQQAAAAKQAGGVGQPNPAFAGNPELPNDPLPIVRPAPAPQQQPGLAQPPAGAPQVGGENRPGRPQRAPRNIENDPNRLTEALDFNKRIEQAITFNPKALRDLIAGRLITSDDDRLIDGLQRCPALERPVISLQFMVGTSGMPKQTPLSVEWMQLRGAEREFGESTGDAGKALLQGLQERISRGSFGDWAADLDEHRNPHETSGMLFANADSPESLQSFAAQQGADVLIAVNATIMPGATKNRLKPIVTLVVQMTDVANNKELWTSQPINSDQIVRGRVKAVDPGMQVVNDLLTYCDQHLTLEALPDLTPEATLEQAKQLTAQKTGNFLLKLALLRSFQCLGWLSEEQAIGFYAKLLDRTKAKQFASSDPTERGKAILSLLPKR